ALEQGATLLFDPEELDEPELHSQEYDNSVIENQANDRYKIGEGYRVVPSPSPRTFLPPKPALVFTDDTNANESVANVINVESSKHKTSNDKSKTHRPDAPIIEDCISDSEDETKIEFVPKQREPSSVKSTAHVKNSRESVKKVEHNKQAKNLRTNNQKSRGGKIFGKGKIKTGKLDFDDVYFVMELKFNLFSVLQMCDKKNSVLFTNIECVILSSYYKLPDENHVLLRVPKENNMYNVDQKNVVPSEVATGLAALSDTSLDLVKTAVRTTVLFEWGCVIRTEF
nr:ribonuclease H-like domain-containing protein [Tanacetum cinerariifolium]